MRWFVSLTFGSMALAAIAAPAWATPLADNSILTPGLTVLSGDKLFSNFTCSVSATSSGGLPSDCSSVLVTPTTQNNLFGIQIQAGFEALNIASEDVLISYVVTVTDPNNLISDVHMDFNGSVVSSPGDFLALTKVIETIFPNSDHSNSLGQITVVNPPPILSAFTNIDPQSALFIMKDISLTARDCTQVDEPLCPTSASISYINQTFSQITRQEAPEPASLALLGAGLVGLGLIKRRRRRRAS